VAATFVLEASSQNMNETEARLQASPCQRDKSRLADRFDGTCAAELEGVAEGEVPLQWSFPSGGWRGQIQAEESHRRRQP
jgi:hypothetical protein